METLYRKVAVSERMPEESAMYLVITEHRLKESRKFNADTKTFITPMYRENIEYWLEEIPDPTAQLKADKAELLEALQDIHDELENGDTPKVYKIESIIQKMKQ